MVLTFRRSNDSSDLAMYFKITAMQEAVELHALDTMLQRSGCNKSQTAIVDKIATIMPSFRWNFASVVNRLRSTHTMFVMNREV